jgi:hypothetical protein
MQFVESAEMEEIGIEGVEDIVDPKAYSIEEAKQKAERDRRHKTAEEKKTEERGEIKKLRKEFENLLAEVGCVAL